MEQGAVSPVDVQVEINNGNQQPQKTKAQLKAERRAKQEAQRAAKDKLKNDSAGKQNAAGSPKSVTKLAQSQQKPQQTHLKPDTKDQKALEKSKPVKEVEDASKVEILSHLKQYCRNSPPTSTLSYSSNPVHPAFVRLGVQMAREIIVGSNERCAALICAVKMYVKQYKCPRTKEIRLHLNTVMRPCFNYLGQCRKMSVSMENFVKFFKMAVTQIEPEMTHDDATDQLLEECDRFFEENIFLAAQAIVATAIKRINNGDKILIYGRCPLILRILLTAKKEGKDFRVMVVDSRPDLRGAGACERLTAAGIPCSYIYINSATYVMKNEVTKVLLTADGLLANGYVLGPVGTAMLALIANTYNRPVIVCCETYKFSERVQTDSILFNELADPEDLLKTLSGEDSQLENWREQSSLHVVNLVYDATPPTLVSIVITEIAELPCTSAPVILRRSGPACY